MTTVLGASKSHLRNDYDWVTSTLSAISKESVDRLTVSAICNLMQISRPTFYSRFGNIDGLLAEVWLESCELWLNQLISNDYELNDTSRALTQILAVSRRKPELNEVVRPVIELWWEKIASSDRSNCMAWLAANRIGVSLLEAVDPGVVAISIIDRPILELIHNDQLAKLQDFSNPKELHLKSPDTGDSLLDATIHVISTAGYIGASMSRIARYVQMTTGAIYPHFKTTETLIQEAYSTAQRIVVEQNSAMWMELGFSVRNFGQFIASGLSEERALWRNLRLETILASSSQQKIRTATLESIVDSAEGLEKVISESDLPKDFKTVVHYLFHTLGVGFGVIHEFAPEVAALQHVAMAERLGQLLFLKLKES